MPLYDYQCTKCDHILEDLFIPSGMAQFKKRMTCPVCGDSCFEMVLSGRAIDDWGQGKYFEHLSSKGETFYSKRQFKDYLKRKGLKEKNAYT